MKTSRSLVRGRPGAAAAARRAQFLAEFDRSGLSAAAFARKHGIHSSTETGQFLILSHLPRQRDHHRDGADRVAVGHCPGIPRRGQQSHLGFAPANSSKPQGGI